MYFEPGDRSESKAVGRSADFASFAVSNSDMANFQTSYMQRTRGATTVAEREQDFFNGFSFDQVKSPYGEDRALIARNSDEQPTSLAEKKISWQDEITNWTKQHPLRASTQIYKSRDDAAKAAFNENRLEDRSKLDDKE